MIPLPLGNLITGGKMDEPIIANTRAEACDMIVELIDNRIKELTDKRDALETTVMQGAYTFAMRELEILKLKVAAFDLEAQLHNVRINNGKV